MPNTATQRRAAATVAALGLIVSAVACIMLDVLVPGRGPLAQPLSFFAHTAYAWLWQLAVAAAASALLLLAWALGARAASRSFRLMLAVAGLGFATTGLYTADLWFPWERTPTLGGGVHVAAVFMVVLAISVAMARRRNSMLRDNFARWYRACEVSYLFSLVGAVMYVAVTGAAGRAPQLFGLWERLLLATALAWCALLALGARKANAR